MSRTLERSIARKLYAKFSRNWRDEKRAFGVYGAPGYRKPSFSEWYVMHQKNLEDMRKSVPADVAEFLGQDPWDEPRIPNSSNSDGPERGVVTIDIAGGGDEQG